MTKFFIAGGTGFPNDFLKTSLEHYPSLSAGGTTNPEAAIESVKNWGPGPITYFRGIPKTEPAFAPELPEFPAQFKSILALTLADGTAFAHAVTAFWDLPGGVGVVIFEGIWISDSSRLRYCHTGGSGGAYPRWNSRIG
ncbi:hypothetical protein SAMD00023353_1601140 [Rosellinia necatrix]|uniref:Uncharacterized protein n=1 Tax=Rosellinia necatrix TaxID=77044 RepID=A0A1W2TIB0_ROSNE|nr:hypothetical protein SAMD00023353_1601140 [Rosellinia necatrix]